MKFCILVHYQFKRVWLSIIFTLVNVIAFTQLVVEDDPYVKFDHLNVKSGLSNNYILDIFQDDLKKNLRQY